MLKTPVMSKIFDVVEASRAKPNGRSPFVDEIEVLHDVVYKTVDGKDLVMDIYLPPKSDKKAPVVLEIPGGGWMIHNRKRRDGYARLFAVMGAAVCVIDHRLSPEVFFPENLKDVVDAANFIADNAEKYNFDASNLTVTGDSSGGHLAACLACASSVEGYGEKLGLAPLKTKVSNCIFISGAFSFETMYRIPCTHLLMVRYFSGQKTRKAFRKWEFYREADPYNYITPDFPESYNNGGGSDLLCLGEAKRMAGYLNAAGVKNQYNVGKNIFNNAHCYVLRLPFKPARRDMLKIMEWYAEKQAERGVNLSEGLVRVTTFLVDYKRALKGEVKC